ncbi:MAG: hypothetical protein AB1942_00190 [Pseudomonadota bacterium]
MRALRGVAARASLKLILTFMIAVAIAGSSLSVASAAHAALDDGAPRATAAAATDAAATHAQQVSVSREDAAFHGGLGAAKACTGHCVGHVVGVPALMSIGLYFRVEPTDWSVDLRRVPLTWTPSSLDRPPRA